MIRTLFTLVFFFVFQQLAFSQQIVTYSGQFGTVGDKIEILTDSNSNISLQAAMKSHNFKPSSSHVPNLSITPNSYWIKATVVNNTRDKNLAIQLAQPIIDYVDFYEFRHDSLIVENHSGDRRPFNERVVKNQTFIYPINIEQNDSVTIYLYLKSGKQLMVPLYVGSEIQTFENALTKDILFGIYLGIIFVMIFYNLFIYTTVKDKSYIFYVLYLAVNLITQTTLEGYTFRMIFPDNPDIVDMCIYLSSAAIGLAAIEFSKNFLSSKTNTPGLHKISYAFWVIYAAACVLALTRHYNQAYQIILGAAMISSVYVLAMAIRILMKGSRSARFFLIAWSVFIVCVVVYVLKDFGILPYNNLTSSALLFGSAFEAVMLSFALADKINTYKKEKEQSQAQAMDALQENERIVREQNVMLEAKVDERTHELQVSNDGLNKAMKELKDAETQLVESEKMASLGQLTAGIAHEINNPINFVTSNVKPLNRDVRILLDAVDAIEQIANADASAAEKQKKINAYKEEIDYDYLKEEIDQLLSGIGEGASRTAEIVKGLRIFSRLDEDDLKKANINEGLESTLVITNNLLNNIIKIEKHYADLPLIECYPGKLNQVFLNIISNGIYAVRKKFADAEGGLLTISTSFDDTSVFIKIADNGTGMDENTKKKLFEPFFTTKDVGEGTGLGLSIAYNTINKHNGQIQVNSEIGKGTEFILILPLIQK